VIEQTIRQKLPKDFQRSEFLLAHGMIDEILDRREMRAFLIKSLDFMMNPDLVEKSHNSTLKFQVATAGS
jgi:acetyl-CoA carboxylase carboxyl transferase subunit beta